MAKRKILIYLIIFGILFVATLILIFWHRNLFKIRADTGPTCGNNICELGENVGNCPFDCAKTNPSIHFEVFLGTIQGEGPNGTEESRNNFYNYIVQQFQFITNFAKSNWKELDQTSDKIQFFLNRGKVLKEKNTSNTVIAYKLVDKIVQNQSEDFTFLDDGGHENCFLHQKGHNGKSYRFKSGDGVNSALGYYVNPKSQCWKDALLIYAKSKLGTEIPGYFNYNFDGIWLDEALAKPKCGLSGTADIWCSPDQIDDDLYNNWQQYIKDLVNYVKANVDNDKLMLVNGIKCDLWKDQNCNQDLVSGTNIDATMFETFAYNGYFPADSANKKPGTYQPYLGETAVNDPNYDKNILKKQLDIATNLDRQGKIVLISNFPIINYTDSIFTQSAQSGLCKPVNNGLYSCLQHPAIIKLQRYLLTTYLLIQGDHTYYGFAGGPIDLFPGLYNSAVTYADWGIDVGKPVKADAAGQNRYEVQNGVLFREFNKALVVVNPNTDVKTIKLDKKYYTPEGQQVSGEYVLEPHQGQILLIQKNMATITDDRINTDDTKQNISAKQLLSTGASLFYIILIVLTIILTILLKQYVEKNE